MSRKPKRILIAVIAILPVVLAAAFLPSIGIAHWIGSSVVTIVVQTSSATGDPVAGCTVELRHDADLVGDDGEIFLQATTDAFGIATLTGELPTHGETSDSMWGRTERMSINCHRWIIRFKTDGYQTDRIGLWEVAHREYVNPAYPLVVPIHLTMKRDTTTTVIEDEQDKHN